MSKLTLGTVTNTSSSGSSAAVAINANSSLITTAVENTLSRDGSSPNEMNADLDMNDYDILDAGDISADSITLAGQTFTSINSGPKGDPGTNGTSYSFSGAFVYKASDLTAQNLTAAPVVTWDSEAFDVGGWHEGVTHPSRLTVPTGVSYVRVTATIYLSSCTNNEYFEAIITKNGAAFRGSAISLTTNAASTAETSITTPPLAVTPGDYFEVTAKVQSDTSVTINSTYSCFAIQGLG